MKLHSCDEMAFPSEKGNTNKIYARWGGVAMAARNKFSAQGENPDVTSPGSYRPRKLHEEVHTALPDPVEQREVKNVLENNDDLTWNLHSAQKSPEESMGQEDMTWRYPHLVKRARARFMINALKWARHDHEPIKMNVLKWNDPGKWRDSIGEEITVLGKMKSWEVIERAEDQHILHSKFVTKRKSDENGIITRFRARMVVCGKKDTSFKRTVSHPRWTLQTTMIIRSSLQRGCNVGHLDFENGFWSAFVDWPGSL